MEPESASRDHEAVALAAEFYAALNRRLPASTTLGELIVLTEIALGVFRKSPSTVTEVAESTGLSRWTVGRIIQRYIERGMIREQKDPADSRRNLLVWTDEAYRINHEWAEELNRLWSERLPTQRPEPAAGKSVDREKM